MNLESVNDSLTRRINAVNPMRRARHARLFTRQIRLIAGSSGGLSVVSKTQI
mgnify:CR=1